MLQHEPQEQSATPAARAAASQKEQAAAAQAIAMQPLSRPRHRWRGRWWLLFGVSWAVYGITHGSFVQKQGPGISSSQGIVIRGDNQVFNSNPAGKNVEVRGDGGAITLNGDCPWLIVHGDHNMIRVKGVIKHMVTNGDNNVVIFTRGPAPTVSGSGDGNKIEQAGP